MNDIRCTMLIPHSVGPNIIGNVTDLHLYNVSIINTIKEVNSDTFSLSDKLVIIGFIPNDDFLQLNMLKDFMGLDVYFISDDYNLCNKYSSYFKCYNLNHIDIGYEMLISVLLNDLELSDRYKINPKLVTKSSVSIAKDLVESSNRDLSRLSNDYLSSVKALEDSLVALEKKDMETENLRHEILGLMRTSEYYLEENKALISKFADYHNRVMDYNVMFTEDLYNFVNLADYKYPPRIIYFKEYTEFLHLESFITTLVSMLQLQKKSSFKIVRLFDSCDLYRYKSLDERYLKVQNKYFHSNIIVSDYLAVMGNYEKVFDIIFNSGLEYLIVIDHKKFEDVTITGEYLRMNLCRNITTAKRLELPLHNTIVNNYNGVMSWDTYPNYKEIQEDPVRRVSYLTSRPVMTKIYNLVNDII